MTQASGYVGKQFGSYQITEERARGASAILCLGRHLILLKRPFVAIKILHTTHLSSQQARDRFLQEAQILEELKHPHILPLLDVNIQDDIPYLVIEYAPGGSLRDRLQQQSARPMPVEEALVILTQLGQALAYAHQHRIIHRDLKPENILFNRKGEILLADFGIATMLNTASMKQTEIIGTPKYMAPEQFRGIVSKKSDQYALGCIAYELLTGRPPFLDRDIVVLMTKHTTEYPPPPTQLNRLLPPSLEPILWKALVKEPNNRYKDILTFVAALQNAFQQRLYGGAQMETKQAIEAKEAEWPVLEGKNIHLITIGSPSAGRSCYISMALKKLMELFEHQYGTVLSLDAETKQFLESEWQKLQHGRVVLKTVDLRPRPCSVEFPIPQAGKSRRLYLYDAAGELFHHPSQRDEEDFRRLREEDFGWADALFFMIDPFGLPLYRRLHHQEINRVQNRLRPVYTQDQVFLWMQEILDGSFRQFESSYSQPIAVVVSKVDALNLENEIGQPAAQTLMQKKPLIRSEEEAISSLVRDFLISYGLDQFIQNIERKFVHVKYFSCAPLGRLDSVLDQSNFVPIRVMEPLLWLLTKIQFFRPT